MRPQGGRGLAPLLAFVLLGAACGQQDTPTGPAATPTTGVATTLPGTVPPITADESPADRASAPCAHLSMEEPVALQVDPVLTEISGAVISRRSPNAVWVHEDSANPTVLTEVGLDGTQLGRWTVPGVDMVDWEDIAAITDEIGARYLVVGDIGDNRRQRDHLQLVRVEEPDPDDEPGTTGDPVVIRLVLPDEAHDAEALLVAPGSGDVVIVTKSITGVAEVFVGHGAVWADHGSTQALEWVGSLVLGPGQAVLAADLSPDGTLIALRTPARVLLWSHDPNRAMAETLLDHQPCRAPTVFEIQGEAIAMLNEGYVLLGESAEPELIVVR